VDVVLNYKLSLLSQVCFASRTMETLSHYYLDYLSLQKTRRPDTLPDPVVIPALTPLVGPELDRLLCPVRALKYYLRATADPSVRKGRLDLFIPYSGSIRATSPAMISSWLCAVIHEAYDRHYHGYVPDNFQATANEIRAMATSRAAINKVPMEEILQAATWKHHTTFTSHYLREISSQTNDLFSLGPLVVAHQVIQPPQ